MNSLNREPGANTNQQKNYYEMKHKGRKVHSLNSSIDYQNKFNKDLVVSSNLTKKKASDIDNTVIYDSNST
jgi:hypothetical protein